MLEAELVRRQRQVDRERFFSFVGYDPHPGQILVHRSDAQRRVVACGVRWGKTLCAAMEGVAAALEPSARSVGWIVAPNYELSTKVFREVVRVFREKFPHRVSACREHDHLLSVLNMGGGLSEVRGKSADNPVSLLGEGLDWLVVDEAARLRPDVWQRYLSARLVDREGWAMLISTPRGKGWFYDLWRRGQAGAWRMSGHESWNLPSWSNPLLRRAAVDAERERLPEAVFRQEFGAEFLEGIGQVFRGVRDLATGELEEPRDGATYVAGLDLARVDDYTVLVVLDEERRVVHVDRFTRLDWTTQVTRIRAALERYNDALCFVDSTGAGEPIYETLAEAGCRVDPYAFTAASKAALVNNLSLMLERREIALPRAELCPELIDELESFEYTVTDSGGVRSSAPSGMHDDCVCALMLAAWGAREPGDFEVQWV